LTLHPTKTKIVDIRVEGFDFLGYHFQTTRQGRLRRWPGKKSMEKLRETLRGKTKRTNGNSLGDIIKNVSISLRGWFGYFKHSNPNTLRDIDQWVRMRLRSILRRRLGLRGRGRGRDHHRWQNVFFAEHGLFSLLTAHEMARQSPLG
jgi:RNA-directed DNA polymerase